MVDRIKFIVDNASLSEEILRQKFFRKPKNKKGNTVYLYKNNFVEEEDFTDGESEVLKKDSNNTKYRKHLYIQYIDYGKPKKLPNNNYDIKNELIIHRNLRKDGFGDGTVRDLNFTNFEKVIRGYSKKFIVEEKKFWNARITQLELGVTVKLSSKMRGILTCFENFKDLTEKNVYSNNGIAFIGENFSVSIYDKIEKMWSNKELFKNAKRKKYLKDKVSKNNYFLRLELKIMKVSGFNRSAFVGKIDRLKDIRDNWNYLGKALLDLYSDINYIDVLSPEVEDTISGQERKPMDKFLKFQGIKSIGFNEFFNQILPLMKGRGVRFRKEYQTFVSDYEKKYRTNYEAEFAEKVENRIESLRKMV